MNQETRREFYERAFIFLKGYYWGFFDGASPIDYDYNDKISISPQNITFRVGSDQRTLLEVLRMLMNDPMLGDDKKTADSIEHLLNSREVNVMGKNKVVYDRFNMGSHVLYEVLEVLKHKLPILE